MSESTAQTQLVSSPCISVCLLDEHQVCVGCFRTADEIAQWAQFSEQQRRQIIDQLGGRASRR